jgi:hypothetical protein
MRDPCKENSAGAVFVRLGGELYDRLEDFRRRQAKIPHRSEALRSLIERASRAERVQLPAFPRPERLDVALEAGVRLLGEVRRRVVLPHLVEVQGHAPHLDRLPGIKRQPVPHVAGHVDPVGVVVGEVQCDGNEALAEILRKPLACLVLQRLRVVADGGEVGHAQIGTNTPR